MERAYSSSRRMSCSARRSPISSYGMVSRSSALAPGRSGSSVGVDAIACFLRGTLTRAERRLSTLDEHQRLRDMRMLFQYSAEDEFRSAVEAITGRVVISFISGIDTKSDIASEIFILESA